MRSLTKEEVGQVDGAFGFFFQAIAFAVTVFVAPNLIRKHAKDYAMDGQALSQNYFDSKYPYDPNSNECYGPYC